MHSSAVALAIGGGKVRKRLTHRLAFYARGKIFTCAEFPIVLYLPHIA
jgi:hypothetical protein